MQIFKRGLSFLLSLVLIFSMVPAVAQAEEEPQTQVSSGDMTVEGTNSLGTLLSEDIEEYQQTDETAGGYNVVDLTFENGVATAQFRTLETAILMVAVYTEDGVQLVTSGYAQVQPEESTVSVTMSGKMPQYFVAAAYLVDVYDHSPLCTAYETVMYTQEMQELLASTVDDYDPELVLNLDDSTETNFAVYEENTVVIEEQTGVNTVASVDDENAVYVIENADESITSLVAGDIFVLPYGEDNILIVKVASISVDGTTVTVTGADVDLDEVFSCMKIESTGQTEDLVVDETTGDEEVTYVGMIEESEPALRNSSGDYTGKLNLGFEFKQKSGSVSYSGSLNVNINVGFSYYISVSKQQIKLTVDTKTNLSFKFGGKIEFEKKLPSLKFSPIPAVSVGFEPKVVFKISAEIEFVASVVNKTGFSYERGKGVQNLSTAPKIELDINAKGTVFFGIDFAPTAGILKGKIAELKLSALAGVELTGKMCGTLYDGVTVMGGEPEKSIHDCESCLEVKIQGKIEMKLSLEFLNMSFLKVEFKLTEKVFEIGACYYSFDQQKFGWGECPNVSYRVTVLVKNANNEIVEDVEVYAQWIDQMIELPMGSTNSAGTTVDYLTGGTYTFIATVDGETLERTVKISKACKVDLNKYTVDLTGFLPSTEAGSVMDAGVLASETCGDNGYNLTWKLDYKGTLTISGTGRMYKWFANWKVPWVRYNVAIKKVIIEEGVTYIGDYAFSGGYKNLTEISIPDTVTEIGYNAFAGTSIETVVIPDSVVKMGSQVFASCSNLKTVTIGKKLSSIGTGVFASCSSLEKIQVDESNTYFCNDAQGCLFDKEKTILIQAPGKLSGSYVVPNSVLRIKEKAFSDCKELGSVMLRDGVTHIEREAFRYCTGLVSISIPNSVISIGNGAFLGCTGLKSIELGDHVEYIDNSAFSGCMGLVFIAIPNSTTNVGEYAFSNCAGLLTVIFEGNAPSIASRSFEGVETIAYYPAGDSTWTTDVLRNYGGTITWIAYDPAVGVPVSTVAAASTEENQENAVEESTEIETKSPATRGVFGGEYDTQVTDSYTLKTASFSGLVAGEEYLLLALVSLETEDALAANNLLAIDQGQAGQDGTLVFTYAQRVNTNISYVMACGASNKNLEAAEITFPFMTKTEETEAVDPVVTYEGQVLTEGVDYTIVGTVDYTAAGTYTCYVRGIRQYAGLVECAYTVVDATVTETEQQTQLQLNEDCAAVLTLDKDLYVDLNGFDMTGTITANGYKVYGMDSATDSYSCDAIGYFNCTDENGEEIVPVQHFKTDSKRYMAICDENGWSFHRFYLGITHMSLKPTTSGVGYKAVFWGDEMVAANLDSFGFTMCLEGNEHITAELSAEKFVSGKVITLRIDNYGVERYGEAALSACVTLTLSDGTEICGTEQTMTLRGMLEQLNESYAAFTEAQLAAVKDFLSRYPITQNWKTENLT